VWAHIFTLYLLADTVITHKLLACGLEKCLTFKDDSTAVFTTYIATVNESASQLGNMPPMSITDIYALVTLMGLHMSSSDRHEKAYRELIAYVDEGNAITLEKVQQMGLKYSCSLHPVASSSHTFTLTSEDADEVCNHNSPRCCYTRDSTSRSFRTSSGDGSPRHHRTFCSALDVTTREQISEDQGLDLSIQSMPQFSTATTWHPSKFSLPMDALVFSTQTLAALSTTQPPSS
jgi:hypothetical protein